MSPTPPARLFHVVLARDWQAHVKSGAPTWQPPSLATEGFCHLSFAPQVRGTLATHYREQEAELLLLELDPAELGTDLRLEPSRGGQLFPHLYRGLRSADLLRTWPLPRSADGWTLPF